MTTLTQAQQKFTELFTGEERNAMTDTLRRGDVLFASVVVCMNGQYATGTMSLDDEPVPALNTRKYIEDDIAEEAEELARQIASGERDEDDELEMELMAVRWHSDDTLSFYTPENLDEPMARQSIACACGML